MAPQGTLSRLPRAPQRPTVPPRARARVEAAARPTVCSSSVHSCWGLAAQSKVCLRSEPCGRRPTCCGACRRCGPYSAIFRASGGAAGRGGRSAKLAASGAQPHSCDGEKAKDKWAPYECAAAQALPQPLENDAAQGQVHSAPRISMPTRHASRWPQPNTTAGPYGTRVDRVHGSAA